MRHADPSLKRLRMTWTKQSTFNFCCRPPYVGSNVSDMPVDIHVYESMTAVDANRWLRQPATFVRWRLDLTPEDCVVGQLHA